MILWDTLEILVHLWDCKFYGLICIEIFVQYLESKEEWAIIKTGLCRDLNFQCKVAWSTKPNIFTIIRGTSCICGIVKRCEALSRQVLDPPHVPNSSVGGYMYKGGPISTISKL